MEVRGRASTRGHHPAAAEVAGEPRCEGGFKDDTMEVRGRASTVALALKPSLGRHSMDNGVQLHREDLTRGPNSIALPLTTPRTVEFRRVRSHSNDDGVQERRRRVRPGARNDGAEAFHPRATMESFSV